MAIAGLILGVLSLTTFFFSLVTCSGYFVSPFSIGFGILGSIFSILAMRNERTGISVGGLATSLTGVMISTILYLSCIQCGSGSRGIKHQPAQYPQKQIHQSSPVNPTL